MRPHKGLPFKDFTTQYYHRLRTKSSTYRPFGTFKIQTRAVYSHAWWHMPANLSTQEAKPRTLRIWGLFGLHSQTLSQNNTKQKLAVSLCSWWSGCSRSVLKTTGGFGFTRYYLVLGTVLSVNKNPLCIHHYYQLLFSPVCQTPLLMPGLIAQSGAIIMTINRLPWTCQLWLIGSSPLG